MEGCYEVFLNENPAGKVQVIRQGLYYRITCRCRVPEDGVYRLFAVSDSGSQNIGVVVPEGDGYVLSRQIAVKNLPYGCRFQLSSRTKPESGKFVPISPDEPFAYIDQLQNAFLEIRNGQVGARIAEKTGADI